jgi:hypothetical protein
MKRNSLLTIIFLFLGLTQVNAQKLVEVLHETITVNSTSAMSGYTRNTVEVQLPQGTIGYIYRISVFKKGGVSVGNGLLDLLSTVPIAEVKIGANLSKYVVNNANGGAVDYFIFTNQEDKNAFYGKRDDSWNSCKSYPNRVSSCLSSNECINRKIWFGFRNNNISQGLDVYLEVVAIVDEVKSQSSQTTYGFKITNETTVVVNFQLSLDGINWQEFSLKPSYFNNYNFQQPEIFFRISTQGAGTAQYKIGYNDRYKIQYNPNKRMFDLFNY